MKPATYSKTIQAAANRFLSDYHLTFEQLTELQKKQVVSYIQVKRWWPLTLLVFLACMIVFGCITWIKYSETQAVIEKLAIMFYSGKEIDLRKFSSISLEQGIIMGFYALSTPYMILFIIFVPMNIRGQKLLLKAFLPSIMPKSTNEPDKQDKTS